MRIFSARKPRGPQYLRFYSPVSVRKLQKRAAEGPFPLAFIDYIAVTIAQYRYTVLRAMIHAGEQISPILISTEEYSRVEIYEPIGLDMDEEKKGKKLNRIAENYYPKSSDTSIFITAIAFRATTSRSFLELGLTIMRTSR